MKATHASGPKPQAARDRDENPEIFGCTKSRSLFYAQVFCEDCSRAMIFAQCVLPGGFVDTRSVANVSKTSTPGSTRGASLKLAMSEKPCPFCTLPSARVLGQNEHALWIRDGFPVSPGHSLVIPKRHVGSFFEITPDERAALLDLLDRAKAAAQAEFRPDGFNIGINDGPAAGQTVPHLHIHLIPRFYGDQADARGGVRWIIPEKADYWSPRD